MSQHPDDERLGEDAIVEIIETTEHVTFEGTEPELEIEHMPTLRKRCDESWRPGDPGFRF